MWLSFACVFPQPIAGQTSPATAKSAVKKATSPEVIGNDKFKKQVTAALKLLRKKAPKVYKMVTTYVGRIEQGKHSGMWAYKEPPTYELADPTAFYSVTWCASTIAHDAYHSKLYHDHRKKHGRSVPKEVWTGVEAEKKCIAVQLQTMKEIGAPEHEVEHLGKQTGTHYDVDKDGDFDWEDYNKRDW